MFTGIIESTAVVKELILNGSNRTFWLHSPISSELKVDQSVSHNGICLTVEEVIGSTHRVTAIEETLQKTNADSWKTGHLVNLERCLRLNDRIDGHLVQGHVDTTGICINKKDKGGSWEFEFEFPKKFADLIIEKGSICINGISLTVFNVKKKSLKVAVIPYTFEHTNIKHVEADDIVNFEFDLVGKYLLRRLSLKAK
ncbi:riboflavin synthase [Chitinophagaceae bacterium IBVUCB2]|nr:riboflavin synthase [Chitinophagaceae bacterium IBVUCB2]